jgi:L-gulonate 3-dehydrogenase
MAIIGCVGSGLVGRSWAIVFARAGHQVRLWDSRPSADAVASLAATLEGLAREGAIPSLGDVASRISFADSLKQAVSGADYVQESISERVDAKRELLRDLDAILPPHTIVGSSTSSIPASAFMAGLACSARCLIVHPVNPPHLIPLVELCPSPETAPETVEQTSALMTALGQRPIMVAREVEGFILNRLQWALLSEAMHLVGEGYCTPEDVDAVVTHGLARRWAHLGPLAVGHLNAATGLEGYFDGLGEAITRVRDTLRTDYVPSEQTIARAHAALEARMPVSNLSDHAATRDRRILALNRLLQDFEQQG